MAGRHQVEFTASFERNLDAIERFLEESEATQAFEMLLAELAGTVVPNLERFPDMGRLFLERPVGSIEAGNRIDTLRARLRALGERVELREYLLPDYLILYARFDKRVTLLSIRHHRQLSFDFESLWAGS
jgi:plasmid stabilization system protein ParE